MSCDSYEYDKISHKNSVVQSIVETKYNDCNVTVSAIIQRLDHRRGYRQTTIINCVPCNKYKIGDTIKFN